MSARMTMQRRRSEQAREGGDRAASTATRLPAGALQQALAAPSGGAAMDATARAYLEPRLGHDFGQVRVHADAEADRLAQAVDAVAFTSGQDIYFRSGTYAPDSGPGLRLLAHEAAHTVQQAAGPVAGEPGPDGVLVSDPADPFEQAAEQTADRVASGPSPASAPPAAAEAGSAVTVQRFLGFPGLGDGGGSPFDLGGAIGSGISALGSLVGGGVSGAGSLLGGAASAEGSLVDNVLSGAGSAAGGIMSGIGSMVGSEVSGVGSLLGGGAAAIGSALGLGGLGSTIGSAISGGASALGGDISGIAGAVGGDVADVAGAAGGAVGGLAGAVGGDIAGIASGIGGMIGGAASDAGQFVSGLGLPSIRPEDLQM